MRELMSLLSASNLLEPDHESIPAVLLQLPQTTHFDARIVKLFRKEILCAVSHGPEHQDKRPAQSSKPQQWIR
jgi:hypothetical protein